MEDCRHRRISDIERENANSHPQNLAEHGLVGDKMVTWTRAEEDRRIGGLACLQSYATSVINSYCKIGAESAGCRIESLLVTD